MRIFKWNWVLLLFIFSACVKDKPNKLDDSLPSQKGRFVYIANEGSMGSGNASFSLINLEEEKIYNNVFFNKNSNYLGDVLQNILAIDNHLFLSINNSDKITVIDKNDFSFIKNISVRKPRNMVLIHEEKMYVTSLFHPEIHIINPKKMEVIGKINVDFQNTEGIIFYQGKVYVCNWNKSVNYIYEIDPVNDIITDRIPISGYAPQSIAIDKNGDLWVFAGDPKNQEAATITKIALPEKAISASLTFPLEAEFIKPVFNPTKDSLYFLGVNYNGGSDYNGVFKMPIDAKELNPELFIPAQAFQYFWALGVDSVKNQIYVGDPKGFIQQGDITVYDANGQLLQKYTTGLGPGFFYFE